MLKVNLRFLKQRRIIVINQIYMIVSFLFLKSMSFIRYLHRSEEKKCRHGDNNVALVRRITKVLPTQVLHVCSRTT